MTIPPVKILSGDRFRRVSSWMAWFAVGLIFWAAPPCQWRGSWTWLLLSRANHSRRLLEVAGWKAPWAANGY